jgi:hypothetical protein
MTVKLLLIFLILLGTFMFVTNDKHEHLHELNCIYHGGVVGETKNYVVYAYSTCNQTTQGQADIDMINEIVSYNSNLIMAALFSMIYLFISKWESETNGRTERNQ